MQYELL
jgi:hypothetical protein